MSFLQELLIILVAAGIGRIISRALDQPVILGEILMGMFIGNLGFVHNTETLHNLSEIGVLILLFSAGLYMGVSEFKKVGKSSTVVAVLGVTVPFVLGFLASYLFGYSLLTSLFVGGALVATSVGLKTHILKDLKLLRTDIGKLIIGSAVIDDILAMMLLALLSGLLATGTGIITNLLWVILGVAILFGGALTLGIKLAEVIPGFVLPKREDLILLGIVIIIAFGLFSHTLGLEALVGAFLAGLLLSESRFAKSMLDNLVQFGEGFFIPIFFVVMGLTFDIHAFASVGMFAAVVVGLAIISKIVGCGLGAKVTGFGWRDSFATGVAMVPRAELALVLVNVGYQKGVIGSEIISVILVVIMITTLITPPLLKKTL